MFYCEKITDNQYRNEQTMYLETFYPRLMISQLGVLIFFLKDEW